MNTCSYLVNSYEWKEIIDIFRVARFYAHSTVYCLFRILAISRRTPPFLDH